MEILVLIVIGFFVGLIARALKPGKDKAGFLLTTLIGILGAVVGGYLGRVLGFYQPNEPAGWFVSVIGAILILFVYESFRQKTS